MKKNRFNIVTFFILLSLLVTILITIPTTRGLIFYEQNTKQISAYLPIQRGQLFDVIFTHSIHLTDVVEKYEVTSDLQIKQYEFIFEEFGIGMPSNAIGKEKFVYEDGKYHIQNMNNYFPLLKIRNGKTVSKHRLVWQDDMGNNQMVYFNDFFERGEWYTLKVDNLSLLEVWKEVRIHDRVKRD